MSLEDVASMNLDSQEWDDTFLDENTRELKTTLEARRPSAAPCVACSSRDTLPAHLCEHQDSFNVLFVFQRLPSMAWEALALRLPDLLPKADLHSFGDQVAAFAVGSQPLMKVLFGAYRTDRKWMIRI